MRLRYRCALAVLAALPLFPGLAGASGFGLFQHGGRALGQAGAFTARASDPSALTYNPAAIARLEGFQFQAGLDFNNAQDEYSSGTAGTFSARHVINFPPALYLTWHPRGGSPYAFGLGLDAPFWNDINWDPALFPGRFLTRRFELEVAELHPVIAWQVDDSWSVGGGLRYVYGGMRTSDNGVLSFTTTSGNLPVEVEREAKADVDGFGWDVGLHYARPSWGWGAVLRSSVSLDGSGDAGYRARDVPPGVPDLPGQIAARLAGGSVSQSFELPYELRSGLWWAPYPELRLEGDASYQRWSGLDDSNATFNPDVFGDGPTVVRRRGWDDTLSLRFGLEGEITEAFWLNAGIAWEPSPVPTSTVEPGLPRGDATVYSAGFSYNFPHLSFDVGYSLHDHDSRSAPRQELFHPRVVGRYSTTDQVWAASVRWRF